MKHSALSVLTTASILLLTGLSLSAPMSAYAAAKTLPGAGPTTNKTLLTRDELRVCLQRKEKNSADIDASNKAQKELTARREALSKEG